MTEPVSNPSPEDIATWQRTFAPRAFNRTWALLDAESLTIEEEEEMLAATFSQRYHWYEIGTARHKAIADWQVSRVAATLGYSDLARRYGERSLQGAEENNLDAFVVGFAHEAIARAAAEADDTATFSEHLELAKAQLAAIEDSEDRGVLQADLEQMSQL